MAFDYFGLLEEGGGGGIKFLPPKNEGILIADGATPEGVFEADEFFLSGCYSFSEKSE